MTNVLTDGLTAQSVPENVVDEVDMDHEIHKNSVHQRLRANSSIMQLKKILGMSISVS